jgi:hypothetical protein
VISTAGILTGIIVLILTPLVVLYLPIWTSVAAVGAVLLLVTLGGEALLFKSLVIAALIAIGGVLWRRWRERHAAEALLGGAQSPGVSDARAKSGPPPQPARRRAA